MKRALSAASMPDLITTLKQYVIDDMAPEDISAQELVEMLDLAWCTAERWRIEQFDMDLLEAGGDGEGSWGLNA
ncbi:MAG: hypothetical protein ABL864_02255 [Terricaulis sp.]